MAIPSDNFLLLRERDRNVSTREAFSFYAHHRAQQMELLSGFSGARLAVLGAGNCNDLDLAAIAESFGEIHLFDIDGDSVRRALTRQGSEVARVCHVHEQDLTGIALLMEEWRSECPEPMAAQIAAWTQLSPLVDEVGEFDLVVSTCLLSQVSINLRDFFGIVPALNSALCAAIAAHVMLLAALTRPGGTVLLVSDCITSRFAIHEESERRGPLNAILHLAAQGAAFPGTDPGLVAGLLAEAGAVQPEFRGAWLWELPQQAYLVYALQAVRPS